MCVAPGSQTPATEGNHAASDASAEGSCITESESMRPTLSLIRREFVACFAFYLLLWATTLVYVPVLADLHAEWRWNFTFYAAMLLAGVLLVAVAASGFWFELNGWLVLALGALGLALAVAGEYLHAT